MTRPASNKVRYHLVIDPDVLDRVRELAKAERRTVSVQAQMLIEQALPPKPRRRRSREGGAR